MSLEIQQNVSLQTYNSLAVPATAAYLAELTSLDKVREAIEFAQNKKLSMFVLGEGSNTVFKSDYTGLILLNRLLGIELLEENSNEVIVKVSAGENWHRFVTYTLKNGWLGLENLALIPGFVGAAPIQNIGAYGVEVKDFIESVDLINLETGSQTTMMSNKCAFGYRDSIFKEALKGQIIITAVTFCLKKQTAVNISYPALSSYFKDQLSPTSQDVFTAVCTIRSEKLPNPCDVPNAGSFFKNPVISPEQYAELIIEYPNMVCHPFGNDYKVAAAWMIDSAGWKSRVNNSVRVHSEQALVIINPEKRSGSEVLVLAEAIKKDIYTKFGIELEIEPTIS